jgi:two-component system CheB/CheR fusion protein
MADPMPDDLESARKRDAQEAQWRAAEGERLLVVGLGASAGGLDALERLFRAVPAESGLAYVVVQHLDPGHESILAEILGRAAAIPVAFAKDGQGIERDHVYVMPRGADLLLEGGRLRLAAAAEPRASRLPINAFLTSLAQDQGENAVGAVLSGTGSDGALGLAAVKRHGGFTLAQTPRDARYESMPHAAIATGMVDRVLPVEQIPAALAEHAGRRREHPQSARGESEGLREAFEILARGTGHDFSRYKRSTVLRRLQRRMTATSTGTIRDYVALLDRDAGEIRSLADDLTINVTSFFRDGEPFQALEGTVIPELLEQNPNDVRVWIPGCSSGEEAYSIAMLFRERMERMPSAPRAQIFATDIDASALAEARRGRYSTVVEKQVSPERLARFYRRWYAPARMTVVAVGDFDPEAVRTPSRRTCATSASSRRTTSSRIRPSPGWTSCPAAISSSISSRPRRRASSRSCTTHFGPAGTCCSARSRSSTSIISSSSRQ